MSPPSTIEFVAELNIGPIAGAGCRLLRTCRGIYREGKPILYSPAVLFWNPTLFGITPSPFLPRLSEFGRFRGLGMLQLYVDFNALCVRKAIPLCATLFKHLPCQGLVGILVILLRVERNNFTSSQEQRAKTSLESVAQFLRMWRSATQARTYAVTFSIEGCVEATYIESQDGGWAEGTVLLPGMAEGEDLIEYPAEQKYDIVNEVKRALSVPAHTSTL
ncbi:hypothetical protein BAUCODRAFT_147887 [Baudoinia panamericana UAMH 10762]|uniref:Uncharacterized protein n=1 Tax=Baudoinia panamericana (strain UAMH 10762) TaxID=717646 RepID=M2NBH2_BAUPA|nr:uncharacterized protein BAUCODRAFT_147887 [Baudoinia panamericana UAMH 10762]EMC96250.1 hypothetical protein BAUCODRAFT_147887 [Baudoinia panamericana UAMH 10762]